jgi:hypothetical protein
VEEKEEEMTYCRICNNEKGRGIEKGRSEDRNSKAKEQLRAKQSKARQGKARQGKAKIEAQQSDSYRKRVNTVVAAVVDSGATSKKEGEVT